MTHNVQRRREKGFFNHRILTLNNVKVPSTAAHYVRAGFPQRFLEEGRNTPNRAELTKQG